MLGGTLVCVFDLWGPPFGGKLCGLLIRQHAAVAMGGVGWGGGLMGYCLR